jgi:hypothetical protein
MSADTPASTMLKRLFARRKRVAEFLSATAALRSGDLEAILNLDQIVPMEEDAPACLETKQARTGRELAQILEHRLLTILALAEASMNGSERPRANGELGGRCFPVPTTGLPRTSPR